MCNLIMKRLKEFCLRATDNIQVEIPQILESQKYYFTMKKSFQKHLEQFLPGRQRKGSKGERHKIRQAESKKEKENKI